MSCRGDAGAGGASGANSGGSSGGSSGGLGINLANLASSSGPSAASGDDGGDSATTTTSEDAISTFYNMRAASEPKRLCQRVRLRPPPGEGLIAGKREASRVSCRGDVR